MQTDGSSPSYAQLFGELRFPEEDDARSVSSPAAYFVELLGLLEGTFDRPALLARRPDLKDIVLDAQNTFNETAYLDIVNEVLERLVGDEPYERLREHTHPFGLPFALDDARLRKYLEHLRVTPEEFARLFAGRVDPDAVARAHLGLSADESTIVTSEAAGEAELKDRYGLGEAEELDDLTDAARFAEATGLAGEDLRELVGLGADATLSLDEKTLLGPGGEGTPSFAWFERANRLIRLARRTGLTTTELDQVLTTYCEARLDPDALRTVADVVRLKRAHGLEIPDVCGLAAPWSPPEGTEIEVCAGDILTPANRDYRFRLATLLTVGEPDIVTTVRRYRARYDGREPSPFDRGEVGLPEISLVRRVCLLADALGISTDELFDVLTVLESEPVRDLHKILEGGDPAAALWLVQTLFALVTWMQKTGFDGRELSEILGGRPAPEEDDLFDALREALEQAALSPELFVSTRFSERAAQVVHDVLASYDDGVVSVTGGRLLKLDAAVVESAAYDAVADLGVIFPSDFLGLGLGERLQEKIFKNLVHRGHLQADGTIRSTDALALASDFILYRELLFKTIAGLVNGVTAFFPADLADFADLTEGRRAELYDNLIYNGYLDEAGELTDPAFFLDADNVTTFAVNADLADAEAPVKALFDARAAQFEEEALYLEPDLLAELRLTEVQTTRLFESLRFNGHLDEEGYYADQATLESLSKDDFALSAEFAPIAAALLKILQRQIAEYHTELATITLDDLAGPADEVAAERVSKALDGLYTEYGRVLDEATFADPNGAVTLDGFTETEQVLVFARIVRVLEDQDPYRLSPSAVTELGLTEDQRDDLLEHLVASGQLAEGLVVAHSWLPYFADAGHNLDFAVPGFEDFSRDVFFLLHEAAGQLAEAVQEITDLLTGLAERQEEALHTCLADAFGVPAATAAAIAESVAGGVQESLDLLAAPALGAEEEPDDPRFRLACRRIRGFALLAARLGLDPTEVKTVFLDQDLVGKFPEPLTLPAGIERFDALLESADGLTYLFAGTGYWTYEAYSLKGPRKPLTDLSPRFAALVAVDAAFRHTDGKEWIVGHDEAGTSLAFTREPGGQRWAPRRQTWGTIKNNFADPERIDSAFVDNDGRTYLFSGDQYIRYTAGTLDEGYPRPIEEWREREGLAAPGTPVDACFQDRDGTVHLFTADRWITVDGEHPIAATWGRTRSADLAHVDAAYADAASVRLLSGGLSLRYSDNIENDGVLADEGVPRLLDDLPPQFEGGVEAAFTDANGVLHLFKDGKTVALTGDAEIVPTAERWGLLPPALPGVDAAFTGLDGKAYLFSGTTYVRYSTADYTTVDSGYPRAIERDWGGLNQVDASFVMDGSTYLFGVGALLFDVPEEHHADLDAGRLTPALRNLFQEHGLTLTGVQATALTTAEGIILNVTKEGLRVKVRGDGSRFYVRYSTSDYRTPDPGYPKPLSDNWWNLPDDMRLGPVDAIFTGHDNRTYLFAGDRFVEFDARHRWWSEPAPLGDRWHGIPFEKIDAAFVGQDGRTYLFSGQSYLRYSTDDYTRIDDRYPSSVSAFWGRVGNNLARTGKVDAALVLDVTENVDGVDVPRTHTYLFSGDQYVRYSGSDLTRVDDGYPRELPTLSEEPGLGALEVTLGGVDAAFSDRRTAYFFRDGQCHAVSTESYRRYGDLPLGEVACAFIEDGSIVTSGSLPGWTKRSNLEGRSVTATPFRPRTLRKVPDRFRTGLDSVLIGADGNTYLFQGPTCFNVQLGHAYPLAEEWGRPRNNVYETGAVDAVFVGRDGKTYLFGGDQFVAEGEEPLPIDAHWAGLTSVDLAYVRGGKTYLYEKPDEAGRRRYVVYSGTDYAEPGETGIADEDVFDAPGGFGFPDAVLFEGATMLLLRGEECASYNETTGRWSFARPVERLFPGFGDGLDAPDGLRTAFTARDGSTWFFFDDTCARHADGVFGPLLEVRDQWAVSSNPFVAEGGTVDAAFVWRGEYTYLFSGDTYVRYTGPGYRYVDPGYPKKIAGELRKEEPFQNLPESFEDALEHRVDAVVGNDRTIHLLIAGVCHTVSPELSATFTFEGRERNTLAETGLVDATLVADRRVYLFSGDQYVRYSGTDRTYVDDGYPKPLSALAAELEPALPPLPDRFEDGLDAAFRAPDGSVFLFKDKEYVGDGGVHPVNQRWGTIGNEFADGRLDAAFVAPTGELYAFRDGQYVRYSAAELELVDQGFPRTVEDDWGDLPAGFETGPDGAFTFEGRTYLTKGGQYVRYSGTKAAYPQEFAQRWSGAADYRLGDVQTIVGFIDLCRSHPDGLAGFFLTGAEDPYKYLSDLFGWDLEELRWARRNSALLTPHVRDEHLFEIEFLLALADLFTAAGRFGAGPSEIYREVWQKVFGSTRDLEAAATALYGMLERQTDQQAWPALSKTLHDELNVLKRDALVAYLAPAYGTPRDLFNRYLIDVEMGAEGTTSRVREAIGATQLYLHRYLLDLETVELPDDVDPDEVKSRLRLWWSWMRNYRTWEANRKVFLYPENYLRPELRSRKTPAFAALESDLLQGEITAQSVQTAYKRYLDEYTEVSRLAIAGGYVYTADGAAAGERRLVLFGRTRTEPRRYYFRTAEFRDGQKLSATWEPWAKVDVQIDAERVDPVHAFGRVFVFWPVVEAVTADDPSTTTIVTTQSGGGQQVAAPPPRYRVKICYSFRNLTGEWVAAQVLAVDAEQAGPITDVSLYVQASRLVPGVSEHDSIVVRCTYTVGTTPGTTAVTSAFSLTPELYGLPAKTTVDPARPADLSRIFMEPTTTPINDVVRFNAPADTQDGAWFSVDHKGGSFLCRPVAAPDEPAALLPLKGNQDRLPTTWDGIDAAFQLADGTLYFFDNVGGNFVAVPPGKVTSRQTRQATAERFGVVGTNLLRTGVVDAALVRGDRIFLFSGDEYYRYPKLGFGTLDPGYPKKTASNTENLPPWTKVDAAFTGPGGVEIFYSKAREGYAVSGAFGTIRQWQIPGKPSLDAVVAKDGYTYLIFGDQYVRLGPDLLPDKGYPRPLAKNPDGVAAGPGPSFTLVGGVITVDNARRVYWANAHGIDEPPRPTSELGRVQTAITRTGEVDAAYVADGKLFLVSGGEFVRYTLSGGAAQPTIPDYIDAGYPKPAAQRIDAVFRRGDLRYVFSGGGYGTLPAGQEPDARLALLPIQGNWRCLPEGFPQGFTGVLDADSALYFFVGTQYAAYPAAEAVKRPYEIASLPYDIVRLTSSTAAELNRRLLTGGVDALLDPSTQELDELPAFSGTRSDATTVRVRPELAAASVPVSSHLDFDSSGGLYYWEIFFHAPLLIAQALNAAQRFEDARRWYEYVFDPTERTRYWRFLPFLAVDVQALVDDCREDLRALNDAQVSARLTPILDSVEALAPAFRQSRDLTTDELEFLKGLAGLDAGLTGALGERTAMLGQLRRQYDLMGDRRSLLQTYLDDPFDPHAIAELRPEAYRRAVVMAYIDNLLDWGDLLFRQYTAESVDEARMLYIFAYDLLGERPYSAGPRALPPASPYELPDGEGPGETGHLTADGTLLEEEGAVHAGVANPYFYVPENGQFLEYWNRVEDRLTKIRQSLDIMGVSRPIPLFEPPADVMALVRGVATGATLDQLTAAATAAVPPYRFDFLYQRAKELADRLRQLGDELLNAFEQRDGEELALLRNRQEAEILALTRQIKENQVRIAEEGLAEARDSKVAAEARVTHYETLVAEGLSPLQEAQIAMMGLGAAAHFVAGGLKIGAAIASGVPQALIGPFIMGTSVGGDQVGDALDIGSEVSSTLGEGFSMLGELLGVRADQERQEQDWNLQVAISRSDVVQLGHQVASAELQLALARRELEIHNRQVAHLDAETAFMTGKFAGAQLYGWMVERLSGLYFQTYNLTYEMARAAERAYAFERDGSPGFIQPTYWESRRNGLLAGHGLALDLDRLGQAYVLSDERGLEITKRVSLLQIDPLGLLTLKNEGRGEFALTEALFDRDFPGHFRRQIKTVSVTFEGPDGPLSVNATLTQLDSKTVLTADPKAVKYLLDPKGSAPESLRGDWRPSQQIALSDVEYGRDGNGLFELRFDDQRYLPFEGTGAVSRWRLEARRVLADLVDVTITVKYTADQGGETFATAVRGMLKPYPAARYLDVAASFPDEWEAFLSGDDDALVLPITADLLPGLSGRQITGVYAHYEADSAVRFLLNGDSRLPLTEGRVLRTPGLTVRDWSLVLDGDKSGLSGFALILSYRALP
ncbi:hypothetical protein Pth03_76450 [Planotetraspora thailandica]|uniref:Hemopexin n=1 Tax=Planotetraspora thailandica TaxID=487172 RepID=A0A8J3Y1X4_9ACTN|nr:hemopexin repeat-containing protein [Planotetraspora thailandica]GII59256.1 hypothetical protein Pth03_76450 [Planotetraspora thailandica]